MAGFPDEVFYAPHETVTDERSIYMTVLDLDDWEAREIEWTSPYGQAVKFGRCAHMSIGGYGVRPFAKTPIEPVIKVCANSCFGSTKVTFLIRLSAPPADKS